ncbi:unnamed protein product [Ixodes pacificus]
MTRETGGLSGFFLLLRVTLTQFALWVATGTICVLALFVRKGVCKSKASMEGKTVIVTGGSSGIGKETAKDLCRRKARVIIACCDLKEAKAAAQEIFEETQQPVIIKHLDLASFKSVRAFAEDIVRTEPRLDVLVNNAGVVLDSSKTKLTEDGYEEAFQINYLGHFLLTMLLLDLLTKSAPSRVINVSSVLHHLGSADHFEDRVKGRHPMSDPVASYCNNKLAMLLFTRALAHKLRHHGVTVNAVHPGICKTHIADHSTGLVSSFFHFIQALGGKTAREGAQTSIFLAVEPKVAKETGKYFAECRRHWISWRAKDRALADKVFWKSVGLVHLEDSANQLIKA